ncbi:hypothetical protein [Devosia ginsengisoli]|uniref:hypothetical protein n=1 Tax=Devosia ginsengisoli TaxID=400770 RepID=UPI0026EA4C9D|nr:hypothetical protein [Devosia ginsengisoli]MCR6671830.1 hypothetical protein [Devosia ginsengisoli]
MARNITGSRNSEGGLGQKPDAIPNGLLILLLGAAAWVVVVLLGSGAWQFLVATLFQPPA